MFKNKNVKKEETMKVERRENYVNGELKELLFYIVQNTAYRSGYLYLTKEEIIELKEKLNKLCL